MKKSTLNFLKLFRFSLILNSILLFGAFDASALWNSTYYKIESENTDNGRVLFDFLYQKVGGDGSVIPHAYSVYLQYQSSSGAWVNCMEVYQVPNEVRYYNVRGLNGTSAYWQEPSGGFENFNGWGAGNYHFLLNMSNPTSTWNAPVSLRWYQAGVEKGKFTVTFYKPSAPVGLTATTNLCNQVNLTWNQPSNFRAGTNTYYIYRNGGYLGSSTSTSFTDSNPADGTSYNYKVVLYNNYQYGEYSSEVAGNSIPKPDPPSNVTASNDRCDGTVYIQWQWLSTTPANFELQRSTSPTSGFTTISSTLPGSLNYYEDTPPAKNTIYYYRLRTLNNCGDWGTSYSTPVDGYAPAAPAAPSGIAYSFIGTTIHITWTDNSFNEEKFVVTRINLHTGVTNDYDVNSNVTFFNDDNGQLCIPYKYEVRAASNCGSSNPATSGNVILSPDLSNTFPANSFKASKGYFADIVHLEWDNNNRNQIDSYYIYRKVFGSSDSTLLSTLDGAQASYDDNYAENGILYEYSIIAEGFCDTLSVWSNVANDIGFRNPAATVSGKITYGSGEPVKGVTVTAESDEVLETTSLQLNGTNSYLSIPNNTSNNIQNSFTFQTYLRLSQIKASAIFNKGGQYKLNYTGSAFEFSVGSNTLTLAHQMPLDTFVHVSVVFNGSVSSIYIDGKLMASKTSVAASTNNSSPFVI